MTTEVAEGPAQPALSAERRGQHPQGEAAEAASVTAVKEYAHEESAELMSAVLDRPNMLRAYAQVRRNKGAAGVDGMVIGEVSDHLKAHWPEHRQEPEPQGPAEQLRLQEIPGDQGRHGTQCQ